jgi:uncharacterized protein
VGGSHGGRAVTGWEAVAISAIVGGAAVVSALAGFGFALLAVPLLATVLGARDAVALSAVLGVVSSTAQVVHGRAHVHWGVAGRQLAGSAVGMPLGLVVLLAVDERLLLGGIAVTVLVSVVLLARGAQLHHAGPRVDLGAGFVSGVLNTSVGTSGPPLVIAGQARGMAPAVFRSTLAAVFALSSFVAVPLFAASGRFTGEVLGAAAVAMPALGIGWWTGISLHHRVAAARFRGLVLALLVVSAGVAATTALRG